MRYASLTYEFDELEMIPHAALLASGVAEIIYEPLAVEEGWSIGAISLDNVCPREPRIPLTQGGTYHRIIGQLLTFGRRRAVIDALVEEARDEARNDIRARA